jgi:Putative Actinobacterial Holin-X, holin superfamily III
VPDPESKSMPEVATDLWGLTKDYARQETVEPLKGIGRYLGYGAIGALLLALGVILLMLAGLRALQTETGSTFTGNLSWVPYLIVLVVAAALVGWAVSRISKNSKKN